MQPRGKRFETWEVRRVPVQCDAAARLLLDTSCHQGRLLPQALAELFGEEPDVERVEITSVAPSLVGDSLVSLLVTDTTHHMQSQLKITVHHADGMEKAHTYEMEASTLVEMAFNPTYKHVMPSYIALEHVRGLREQYPHRTKEQYRL